MVSSIPIATPQRKNLLFIPQVSFLWLSYSRSYGGELDHPLPPAGPPKTALLNMLLSVKGFNFFFIITLIKGIFSTITFKKAHMKCQYDHFAENSKCLIENNIKVVFRNYLKFLKAPLTVRAGFHAKMSGQDHVRVSQIS